MMILDVTSDQIWRNLVSHYPRKTSTLQKFSSPTNPFSPLEIPQISLLSKLDRVCAQVG